MAAPPTGQRRRRTVLSGTEVTIARFNMHGQEVSWRAPARDTLLFVIVLGITAWMYKEGGTAVICTALLLMVVSAFWEQHDRRVGSSAVYQEMYVDPRLQRADGIPGIQKTLTQIERDRSHNDRATLGSVIRRGYLPALGMSTTVVGVYRYVVAKQHSGLSTTLMVIATVADLAAIAISWHLMEHKRPKADEVRAAIEASA